MQLGVKLLLYSHTGLGGLHMPHSICPGFEIKVVSAKHTLRRGQYKNKKKETKRVVLERESLSLGPSRRHSLYRVSAICLSSLYVDCSVCDVMGQTKKKFQYYQLKGDISPQIVVGHDKVNKSMPHLCLFSVARTPV